MIAATGASRAVIAAIGDVGVIGTGRTRARREGWDAPFAALREPLAGADVAFANFEFPVGEAALVEPGRSTEFWHDRELCAALARAGVHIVSLANNHMMDCGREGLVRTLEACQEAGLLAIGAGVDLDAARAPARLTLRGARTAWLAYTAAGDDAATDARAGVAPLELDLVREDIRRWRADTDALIVSVHWGSMYVDYPPPRVIELAGAIAQAGADVVLGHHPHVVQGAERRAHALVLHSMGDIVFNCRAGDFHAEIAAQRRLQSAVFRITLADQAALDVVPMMLDDDGFPSVASISQAAAFRARFEELSSGLVHAAERFADASAPQLLRYELQSLTSHLRHRRWGRVAMLLGSLRPRHLPLLWQGLIRMGRRP